MPEVDENLHIVVEYIGVDYLPRLDQFDSCREAFKFYKSLPANACAFLKVKTSLDKSSFLKP